MVENRARTNFQPLLFTEGAPAYEQKAAALAAESSEGAVLRMDAAERNFCSKSSSSGKRMGKNRARTNFQPLLFTEGAPAYEQKEQSNTPLQATGYLVFASLRSVLIMRHQRYAPLAAVAKCACKHAHLARCSREKNVLRITAPQHIFLVSPSDQWMPHLPQNTSAGSGT